MRQYLLPRRSRVIVSDTEMDLRDSFIKYECLDCIYSTTFPSLMLEHQREWHGWSKMWRRLKDS